MLAKTKNQNQRPTVQISSKNTDHNFMTLPETRDFFSISQGGLTLRLQSVFA